MSTLEHHEDSTFSADVHIPADASWFDGHFPGSPVLPGIAQLGMVYDLIRHAVNGPVRVAGVSRVRFKQKIVPDDHLTVSAELRSESTRYTFRITRDGELVCTGNMTVVNVQLQTEAEMAG